MFHKTIISSILTSALTIFGGFVFSVLITRYLGPEQRGIFGILMLHVTLITSISQFGFSESYIYYSGINKLQVGKGAFILFSLFFVTFFSLLLISFLSSSEEFLNYSMSIVLLTILSSMYTYFFNLTKIEKSLKYFNNSKILVSFFKVLFLAVIIFYFESLNVQNLLTLNIAIYVLHSLFTPKKVIFSWSWSWSWNGLYDFIKYSLKIHGTAVLGLLLNNFDKVFLYIKGGNLDFGLYIVAFGTSRLLGILPLTLSNVLFSRLAGADGKDISKDVNTVFSLIFIPLIVVSLSIGFGAFYFFPILFGGAYEGAIVPFIILTLEAVLSGVGWLLSQRFIAAGRPGLVFIRQLVSYLPLLLLLVYMPPFDLVIVLSSMMLLISVIKFIITYLLYPSVLNERMPPLLPEKKTLILIKDKILNSA